MSWLSFRGDFNDHQAVVMYELALFFNPNCAEAFNNLGVIYKDKDNLHKAVECYEAMGGKRGEERAIWIYVYMYVSICPYTHWCEGVCT